MVKQTHTYTHVHTHAHTQSAESMCTVHDNNSHPALHFHALSVSSLSDTNITQSLKSIKKRN